MKPRFTIPPEKALAKFFPGKGFRDCQKEAVERVWAGRSSMVLMPTGMGKSLTYQLPVLASDGIGIIISPLIALMEQQSEIVDKFNVNVLSLGGSDATEAQEALRKFPWTGGTGFLFVSPERAETDGYLEFLLRKHKDSVTLVAIDEAHCISQWGYDFRPPYKSLPGILDRAFGRDGWPVVLCLTATLDANDRREVLSDFRLTKNDVVRSQNMLRTNLDLSFRVVADGNAKLAEVERILDEHRDEKVIVYVHRKKSKTQGTRALAAQFAGLGHKCAAFDADLPLAEKTETLAKFASGDTKVVFATGAFGMGIDIPDIRGVVHFLLPESIEQYYQEVGRAGRDNAPAFGILLYTAVNSKVRRDMIGQSRRTVDQVREVWDQVCNVGRSEIKTISPWAEFQGKEDEYALFYAFQRVGAITILARGPGRLECFEAREPEGATILQRLGSATKTRNTTAAIRKLGLDPGDTIGQLFDLYDRGQLKLVRSPDKTLIFRTREILDQELQQIADDIDAKVDARLQNFEDFVALIEAGINPTDALQAHFGAS